MALQEDDSNELYCRVCNQFFSSLHNKKEHLFGKQHLLMLTEEFEREAEQNANGTDKVVSESPDLAPCTAVADAVGANLIPTESMLTISQFTEKFLEQNLSEYMHMCKCVQQWSLNKASFPFLTVFAFLIAFCVNLCLVHFFWFFPSLLCSCRRYCCFKTLKSGIFMISSQTENLNLGNFGKWFYRHRKRISHSIRKWKISR